jgi:hypothetical protein
VPRFDLDLTDPTPAAVEKGMDDAVAAANLRCNKGLLKADRAEYRTFLAGEFAGSPSGVALWLAEKGRVAEFPPTPRATLMGVAWHTTPLGRRVVRVVGRRIEPFNEHPGNRFGPPWRVWPALCLLDPDHVVTRTWAGGEPETIAVCDCGAVGPPEKLGWMVGRCGPCHDHAEEHGAALPGSPPALRTDGQLVAVGFLPSGRSAAAVEWLVQGYRNVAVNAVVWDRQTGTRQSDAVRKRFDEGAPADLAAGLLLPAPSNPYWFEEGRPPCRVQSPTRSVHFACHGSIAAAVDYDGAGWVRELRPGAEWVEGWPARRDNRNVIYFAVALSPDGGKVALGRHGGVERVGRAGEEGVLLAIPGPRAKDAREQRVYAVAFSPDGALLAAGAGLSGFVDDPSENWFGRGGGLYLFDVVRGDCVLAVPTPQDDIVAVAFSPDGTLLFAGSTDCTVRVFDVARRAEAAVLSGHVGGVNALAFSPDGETLASAGGDGLVRLWPWRALLGRPVTKKRR